MSLLVRAEWRLAMLVNLPVVVCGACRSITLIRPDFWLQLGSTEGGLPSFVTDVPCTQCHGSGTQTYEEDGRVVSDTCYHCSGSGRISGEEARADALQRVVATLAHRQACDYRRDCNTSPDGEGFDFAAAENMLSPHDYLTEKAWSYEPEISARLLSLPVEQQDVLIAWVHS